MPAIASLLPGITPPVQPLAPVPAGEGAPGFADLFGNAAAGGGKTLPQASAKAGKHPPREVPPVQPEARGEAEAFATAESPLEEGGSEVPATPEDTSETPSVPAPLVFTPILGMTWIVPETQTDDIGGAPGLTRLPGDPRALTGPVVATPVLSLVPVEHPAADSGATTSATAQPAAVIARPAVQPTSEPLTAAIPPDRAASPVGAREVDPPVVAPAPAPLAQPTAGARADRPAITGESAAAPVPTTMVQSTASTRLPRIDGAVPSPRPAPLVPARRTTADTAALLGARPAATSRTGVAAPAILQPAERIELPIAAPVAQTAQALTDLASPPVDTARPTWPTAMVDHIERLRDAADAVSTSIRLLPDALGAIDVSVRKDGEVTHVQLAAEQPQARALLAEAQPKLAEIAEQRGVRLGQTEIGGGSASTSNGQQQAAAQQQTRQPAAPARAVRTAPTTPDDSRIA